MSEYSGQQAFREPAHTAGSAGSGPVVVGYDGSLNAERAVVWAAAEAQRRDTSLVLVHALQLRHGFGAEVEPDPFGERRRLEGAAILESAAAGVRAAHPDLPLETELSDLDPVPALIDLSSVATLLVTGTRGRGGFARMLLGSVSRRLAAHAACPLVVVREESPRKPAHRVVLGAGPRRSAATIRFAFEAARRLEADLTVVRAWIPNALYTGTAGVGTMYAGHPESDLLDATERAEAAIEPMVSEYSDVKAEVATGEGNTVTVLINAARNARLLVVCAHRRRGPFAVGAGYVVDGVLAHCPVPVAVVPDQ